jgi:hypothetical protein
MAISPSGKAKATPKQALMNLSVEEENLAAIPFAVLERRVGKKVGKIEISGSKTLPDGTAARVTWQVQGNAELGLPTEQDLDIFVALGVLTFRNDFAKTVTFSGREIARILDIGAVHGKFYKRLKLAMDRFIPLRFRALMENEQHEEVKWCNVFQEASFSLNRTTGRCIGSVTWTDKLIQSMDSGFFRLMDANRYMELDGITAKHLYRYLAVAFAKTDVLLVDARQMATEHLGILNPPKYLSRLMQTLEPAFEQLIRIQVLGSYQVVSSDDWRIALHKHGSYVSERKTLLEHGAMTDPDSRRGQCQEKMRQAGFPPKVAAQYCQAAISALDFYGLERSTRILTGLLEEDVLPHVAVSIVPGRRPRPSGLVRDCALCLPAQEKERAEFEELRGFDRKTDQGPRNTQPDREPGDGSLAQEHLPPAAGSFRAAGSGTHGAGTHPGVRAVAHCDCGNAVPGHGRCEKGAAAQAESRHSSPAGPVPAHLTGDAGTRSGFRHHSGHRPQRGAAV